MLTVITLIVILVMGYLSAHFLVDRLQSRFFFSSGIEYIILGLLVGPQVADVMTPEVVSQLSPVMSLAIGSVGLMTGLQLRLRRLERIRAEYYRFATIETMVTYVLVSAAFAAALWFLPGTLTGDGAEGQSRVMAVFGVALALGAAAAVSGETAVRVVRAHYQARGKVTELLQQVTWLDDSLGIILFGSVFCIFHMDEPSSMQALNSPEWVLISIAFGLLLGFLFHLFLGEEENEQKLLLALIGIVIFSSGAAYYLNLSPLLVNLVLGILLANTSSNRGRLLDVLQSVEKPIYVVLLVFAGASWDFTGQRWYVLLALTAVYILLRYTGKVVGGWLAYITSGRPELSARRAGQGLISHGGLAVAMLINYQQVYHHQFSGLIHTCILLSVIINEIISPKLAKDLLLNVEELTVSGSA